MKNIYSVPGLFCGENIHMDLPDSDDFSPWDD